MAAHVHQTNAISSAIYSEGGSIFQGNIATGGGQVNISLGDSVLRRTLNWLSPLSFKDKQIDVFNKRQPNTGEWFLNTEQFHQWLKSKENTTLWCPGSPGTGKTVMASIVIDYLAANFPKGSTGIAYAYCDYKDQKIQTTKNLISSLTWKLVEQCSETPPIVKDLYESCTRERRSPTLSEHVSLLLSVSCLFQKTFIIVDALDECSDLNGFNNDQSSEAFLPVLQGLMPSARLLVTSRPHRLIEKAFAGAPRIDILASGSDIQAYANSRISMNSQLTSNVSGDPAIRDTIVKTINEKCGGVFLLARLQLDYLANQTSCRNLRRALQTLPLTLYETYEDALNRISVQCLERATLAMQVLTWVSCAKRPLAVEELRHALAVEPGDTSLDSEGLHDIDLLIGVCIGLTVVDNESKTIRLVHYTLQEYLNDVRDIRFPDAEARISEICLTYMSFNTPGFPVYDLEAILEMPRQFPFLQYATRYWGHHSQGKPESSLKTLALSFLGLNPKLAPSKRLLWPSRRKYPIPFPSTPLGVTGMHLAAYYGLADTTAGLLEGGMAPDSRDSHHRTPISWAAESGHEAIARLLIGKGADPESKDTDGQTPLSWAAGHGHHAVVELLLEMGANSESMDADGRTPLSRAAQFGRDVVVRILLENGADPESKCIRGQTPLSWAAEEGHVDVARLLLEKGANPDSVDGGGLTPLWWAASGNHSGATKLLLEKGANPNLIGECDQAPLWGAAQYGCCSAVEVLLENGADLELRCIDGRTPLSHAWGDTTVKLLLERGADPEARDNNGRTPLSWATGEDGEGIAAKLLLAWGADPESRDNNGKTPLAWAVRLRHRGVVEMLLEKGADPESMDNNGQTPLALAERDGGRDSLTALLKSKTRCNY